MRKLCVAFVLVLVALTSSSQSSVGTGTAALTWIPASTYTDGSPLQLGEQRFFVARTNDAACSTTAPPGASQYTALSTFTAGIATFVHSALWNGTYYYKGVSLDIFGNVSADSNVGCKRINIAGNWQPPPAGVQPRAPSNLIVL